MGTTEAFHRVLRVWGGGGRTPLDKPAEAKEVQALPSGMAARTRFYKALCGRILRLKTRTVFSRRSETASSPPGVLCPIFVLVKRPEPEPRAAGRCISIIYSFAL